jgi:hypothetical protein
MAFGIAFLMLPLDLAPPWLGALCGAQECSFGQVHSELVQF